jgi:actin related protein 2/3 complex subunit 4
MSTAQQPYFDCIKRTLHAAICLTNYPSQAVERHNKPEVEAMTSDELLMNPITICRGDEERTLIETSINSVRVSCSFKKGDAFARLIAEKYVGFLEQRAEKFHILRRKPIDGYDISFLITNDEAETMHKHKVVDFIIQFISDVEADITAMKMATSHRFRKAAVLWFQATST